MQMTDRKVLHGIGDWGSLAHATTHTRMSPFLLCITYIWVLLADTFVFCSIVEVGHAQCSNTDLNALRGFHKAVNSSRLRSWSTDSNCCLWTGISCNSEGQVVSVDLHSSSLTGSIPPILFELSALQRLNLSDNLFGGGIPPNVANLSKLTMLDLSHNTFLMGPFPDHLPTALRYLDISHCAYRGIVPGSITNSSIIEELFIHGNYFSSFAVYSKSPLAALRVLNASDNLLASSSLQFLLNCTNLRHLSLQRNQLEGAMPWQLGNLAHLEILQLNENLLTGRIPLALGNCTKMMELWLDDNRLHGLIPETFENLSVLIVLSIANNSLIGPIPNAIFKCVSLRFLSLSGNMLSGSIPADLATLRHLEILLLSRNQFSGLLCIDKQFLRQLQVLDVSNNKLEGKGLIEILEAQAKSSFRSKPTFGSVLHPWLARKFLYLIRLCRARTGIEVVNGYQTSLAAILESVKDLTLSVDQDYLDFTLEKSAQLHHRHLLQSSEDSDSNNPKKVNLMLIAILSGVIVFFIFTLIVAIVIFCRVKFRPWQRTQLTRGPPKMNSLRKFRRESSRVFDPTLASISMRDLFAATDGFSLSRVVGDGGFGMVYSATFADGRMVAIKKLCTDGVQGKREFEAEMETIGKVKHPNLVELLAYCMFGDERLLVYEFVQYGSLDTWLHEKEDGPGQLNWDMRLRIALGSARGLSYLHHESNPHVIHRDIKSSNILLGKDFEPKIADFGLARALSPYISHVSTDAAGTLGYMAPEYATSLVATKQVDVYSFGMVLLELGSGRRPNLLVHDKNFRSLARWARHMLQLGYEKDVLDSVFAKTLPPSNQVRAYFAVACDCVKENPMERPTMKTVYDRLLLIQSD